MAQKVHIVLVDDLDGTEATETVSFGLDGTHLRDRPERRRTPPPSATR